MTGFCSDLRTLRALALGVAIVLWLPACSAMADQAAGADTSIYDHQWQLRHSQQGSIGLTVNDTGPVFTLQVRRDGSARGQVACSTWSGHTRVSPELIRVERVVSGRNQCRFDDRRVEALAGRYLNALQAAAQYRIEDGQLHVSLQNGETWLFVRP